MAGKNIFNISFQEIVSSDGYSTTDKIYSINVGDMVAGKLVVPNDTKFVLNILFEDDFNNHYLKTRILNETFKKFHRDILFVNKQGKEKLFSKPTNSSKTQQKSQWKRYYDFVNKYMGKYREYNDKNQPCVELVLKKVINQKDAIFAIKEFLKKYSVVRLTITQHSKNPVDFKKSLGDKDIKAMVLSILLSNQETTEKHFSDTKYVETMSQNPDSKIVEQESAAQNDIQKIPEHIDPVVLSKTLTLTMNQKQTIESARERAQIMANLQYVCVKLLDKNGKFVCNIYPQSVDKIRAARLKHLSRELQKQY